jgi:NTP pyrophosphatase (non-canonical NTP hydrolase)
MTQEGDGDFALGSKVWPGTSKLIEESGELLQVLGKLMAVSGSTNHWSGDLKKMLIEELGDLAAATAFFIGTNFTADEVVEIQARTLNKLTTFEEWHQNPKEPKEK